MTPCTAVQGRPRLSSSTGIIEAPVGSVSLLYFLGSLLTALSVAGLTRQMSAPFHSWCVRRGATYFLFGLKALNDGSKLSEDLVGLLVVLNLSRDQLGKIAQRLGGVEDLRRLAYE